MNIDFWRDRRVFLTGHSGFKGSWLSELFVHVGVSHAGYSLPADVRDAESLRRALVNYAPDVIIHMAAQALVKVGYEDPQGTFDTNVQGTSNLLSAAREVEAKAILVVTSDKVYKDWGEHPHVETHPLGGKDPYSASKAATELVAAGYHYAYDLPIATCRAGNVIGGGDTATHRLIPNIWRAKRAGRAIQIPRPGAIRPWQHVLDCLNGYLTVAEKLYNDPSFAGPWNFGGEGEPWTVLDVVKFFDCPYETCSEDFAEREILQLDSTKARTELGWAPKLSTAEAMQWTKDGYFNSRVSRRDQIIEWMKL